MEKKGELTSAQIITIVIAIMGFLIVLIALYLIFGGGFQTDEDVCKLSVLTRATAPGAAQNLIPLKCRTSKICITNDSSGKCSEQFAGESNVQVIKLSGGITDKRKKIEEVSANAMYDCWSMMGEGKLDLFGSATTDFGLGKVTSSCVICSRVAIDKSVGNNVLFIDGDAAKGSAIDITDYMKRTQIPGQSLTYLQAFTDRGVSSYAKVEPSMTSTLLTTDISTSTKANNEIAFVFMQIKSKEVTEVLKNMALAGGTVAGGTFMSPAGGVASMAGRAVIGVVGGTVVVVKG